MPLYDLTEFLKLSSVLNYNLSASSLNRFNVLQFILGDKKLHAREDRDRDHKSIIMESLGFLVGAYREKRRRLGPMAVIHPIRTAALYCRAKEDLRLVGLLGALFHDVLEDIRPVQFEISRWKEMESDLFGILKRVGKRSEQHLTENLLHLTRLGEESYYGYIGRLLDHCKDSIALVEIKLADRLDNTLDMRIDLQDPLDGVDFFMDIFQILFVRNFSGKRDRPHPFPSTVLNGARRLHQLFKNAVLLSLIRQKIAAPLPNDSKILFDAVAHASLKEAQRTMIHLLRHHLKDLAQQRRLILEALEYCHGGRIDLVTKPNPRYLLDGLFSTYFDFASKRELENKLDSLYRDKPLMLEASLAFITIFLSFINDEKFFVAGISSRGIDPQ